MVQLTFAEMRRNDIDFYILANKTQTSCLVSVYTAQPRAEVAVAQVGVRGRPLFGGFNLGQQLVARNVMVIEEKWRGEMEAPEMLSPVIAWPFQPLLSELLPAGPSKRG